jgi:acid-sensing ion channel, other
VLACDPDKYSHIDPENRTNCEKCAENMKRFKTSDVTALLYKCTHTRFGVSSCEEMFDFFVTEVGACVTYNSFNVYRDQNSSNFENDAIEEWTLEDGYKNKTDMLNVYPQKGTKYPLSIDLSIIKETRDNLCLNSIQGFKVFLHLPNEAPQISKQFYLAAYQRYTQILINPKMTITEPELRDLPVEKRQCYFSDERRLDFFRSYTQNNCEIECIINLILEICHCIMFYMPSKDLWSIIYESCLAFLKPK